MFEADKCVSDLDAECDGSCFTCFMAKLFETLYEDNHKQVLTSPWSIFKLSERKKKFSFSTLNVNSSCFVTDDGMMCLTVNTIYICNDFSFLFI